MRVWLLLAAVTNPGRVLKRNLQVLPPTSYPKPPRKSYETFKAL